MSAGSCSLCAEAANAGAIFGAAFNRRNVCVSIWLGLGEPRRSSEFRQPLHGSSHDATFTMAVIWPAEQLSRPVRLATATADLEYAAAKRCGDCREHPVQPARPRFAGMSRRDRGARGARSARGGGENPNTCGGWDVYVAGGRIGRDGVKRHVGF
jgi:hypothetical protein